MVTTTKLWTNFSRNYIDNLTAHIYTIMEFMKCLYLNYKIEKELFPTARRAKGIPQSKFDTYGY